MKNRYSLYKSTLFIFISTLSGIYVSFAEFTENIKNFGDNLNNNLLSSFATLLLTSAFVVFIYGLVVFIQGRVTGDGDLKKIEKGKEFILWGLVALFVMVSVWGIIKLAQDLLDIKDTQNLDLKPISFNVERAGGNLGKRIGSFSISSTSNEKLEVKNFDSSSTNPNPRSIIEDGNEEEFYTENDAPPDYLESCGEENGGGINIFSSLSTKIFLVANAQQRCTLKDLTESNQKILKSFVNLAIPCPEGTKDLGIVQTEYIPLNKPKIRLCQISSMKGTGRDTKDKKVSNPVFNAVVAERFQKLGEALAKENGGTPFIANSSFRTYGTSFYNPKECKEKPDNCSGDGYSLHQLGIAVDFGRNVMPANTFGDITCKNRAVSVTREWVLVKKLALKFNIKQLANESWHWDAFPDPNTRCQ